MPLSGAGAVADKDLQIEGGGGGGEGDGVQRDPEIREGRDPGHSPGLPLQCKQFSYHGY